MARIETVELRRHGELEPPRPGNELVAVNVGPDGDVWAVWAEAGTRSRLALRPTDRLGWVRVARHVPGLVEVRAVADLAVSVPIVQPLPDGRVLVVDHFCRWRPEGADRNAVVIDSSGSAAAAATFGSGIADVQTTPSGDIWVSYFDEGVYGNDGWGGPGPEPIGHPGLIRWTSDLEQAWRYPYDTGFGVIDDCYALNVAGESAWISYYSSFPIVRVAGDTVDGWRTEVKGAVALLVDDSTGTVAVVGGYPPQDGRIAIGHPEDGRFEPARLRYLAPHGPTGFVGRGAELHAFQGTTWLKLDLADLTG